MAAQLPIWMANQRFVDIKEGYEGHGRIAGR
jgi:hypothetical protein